MIETLSETVILPIAGVILAIVMTLELIQIITDRNNFHEIETAVFFKWMFKSACAVLIVTNTWTIVMGVFEAAQSVVAGAAGVVVNDATVDVSSITEGLEERLMDMDIGPLIGLWFQSLFVNVTAWAVAICIFIVIYGRMLEVYLTASIAPIPMATMMGREWGGMGQNYLRSLIALAFQAFLIIVCVAIYSVLVRNIALDEDVSKAIWTCMGYTILLCFTLFKTSSMARSLYLNENNTGTMDMTVKVFPVQSSKNLLATASVTLGGCFAVRGIQIRDGKNGTFVSMPQRKDAKGEYHDICFPTTAEMRQAIQTAVLGVYERTSQKDQSRGSVLGAMRDTQAKPVRVHEGAKSRGEETR